MTDELEDKGWRALEYLKRTDDEHSKLQYNARLAEHLYKKRVDLEFLGLEGNGSIEQRKAEARGKSEALFVEYIGIQAKADEIKNRRDTAQLTIDYVRSCMANRRQG